jgi:amino acid permease
MKKYFYCVEVLLIICVLTNAYSFFHRAFFRSTFSIVIYIITPVAVLVYLLLIILKNRNAKKKRDIKYEKVFSKN